MANISTALNYALAGLTVSAGQSAILARNVSSAGEETYTRRSAEIHVLPGGGPAVAGISRSTDRQLLDKLLLASSDASGKKVSLDAMNRMSALTGDPEDGQSVAALLGRLQQSLRDYESNPASIILGRNAVEAARAVTAKLNSASDEVTRIRAEADQAMADTVDRIKSLLKQFKIANDAIIRGQGTANELAEALDQRDAILRSLAGEIGIRTVARANNDILIFAEGGALLFEGSPRQVSMASTQPLQPSVAGNALYIDGVAVTGEGAPMPISGGRLAAHAHIRDNVAPQLSMQLDQIAAGLILGFAEKDPSASSTLPDVEGLFTAGGTLPSASAPPAGLAAGIGLNPLAAPADWGLATFLPLTVPATTNPVLLLRDGGFGGPAYVRNTEGHPGYQRRLAELADALDMTQAFGMASGIGGTVSLKSLSTQSSGWVEAVRQTAQGSLDAASAMQLRAGDALARVTGVNIDQEMAALLDLEKSYQASSKVLAIADSMLAALLEAVS